MRVHCFDADNEWRGQFPILLLRPWAKGSIISSPRRVRSDGMGLEVLPFANWLRIIVTAAGERKGWSLPTFRTVRMRSLDPSDFKARPCAPAARVPAASPAESAIAKATTQTVGQSWLIRRIACAASMSGMVTSSKTRSGRSTLVFSIASAPVVASRQTVHSGKSSRRARMRQPPPAPDRICGRHSQGRHADSCRSSRKRVPGRAQVSGRESSGCEGPGIGTPPLRRDLDPRQPHHL